MRSYGTDAWQQHTPSERTARRPHEASAHSPLRAREAEADRAARKATEAGGGAAAQGLTSLSQHGSADAAPGGGRPLASHERALFESGFGRDFSRVRVHADAEAAHAADEASAEAFTVGQHIVFGAGRFEPFTPQGRQLLAHELAHTAQQQGVAASGGGLVQREPKDETPKQGIGSAPPAEDYRTAGGVGPEDSFVLFEKDGVTVAPGGVKGLLEKVATFSGPVTVEIHGYANGEGDPNYAANLSAHRAAAVKALLLAKLPPDSEVVLYARGETSAFGKVEQNRRAGVKISAKGLATGLKEGALEKQAWRLTMPQLGQSLLQKPTVGFGLQLTLPPTTVPPLMPPPTLSMPALPKTYLGDMLKNIPPEPPINFNLAPLGGGDQIDWLAVGEPFRMRGLHMTDQASNSVVQTWQGSYNLMRTLGFSSNIAAWAANLGTAKAYEDFLAREQPTALDKLDAQWEMHKKEFYPDEFSIPPIPIITPDALNFIGKTLFKKDIDFHF